MGLKTLYIDEDVFIDANIKRIKNKDYKSFTELIIHMWNIFFDNDVKLKGYSAIKKKQIPTTQMKRTSVEIPKELETKIEKYLDRFTNEEKYTEEKSFSQITNEIITRFYILEEAI